MHVTDPQYKGPLCSRMLFDRVTAECSILACKSYNQSSLPKRLFICNPTTDPYHKILEVKCLCNGILLPDQERDRIANVIPHCLLYSDCDAINNYHAWTLQIDIRPFFYQKSTTHKIKQYIDLFKLSKISFLTLSLFRKSKIRTIQLCSIL